MPSIEPIDDATITKKYELLYEVLEGLSKEFDDKEINFKLENAASNLVMVYADGYRQMYSELGHMLKDICDGTVTIFLLSWKIWNRSGFVSETNGMQTKIPKTKSIRLICMDACSNSQTT